MTTPPTIEVVRAAGHPWNNKGPWDRLLVSSTTQSGLIEVLKLARERFWNIWIQDDDGLRAVLYKPTGIRQRWKDNVRDGYDII